MNHTFRNTRTDNTRLLHDRARKISASVAVAATLAVGAAMISPSGASAASPNLGTTLHAGSTMAPGQYLQSADGRYQLIMQGDGNLVIHNSAGAVLFQSETYNNPGAWAVLQTDGNFVVYAASGRYIWTSHTQAGAGAVLAMQTDANLVIYAGSRAVWATMTGIAATSGRTLASNPGASGQCTWWAENQAASYNFHYINTFGPNNGNAKFWAGNAAANGWRIGSTPRIGSIAVFQPGVAGAGSVGHVAWVEDFYPSTNTMLISEMNWKGPGIVDERTVSGAAGTAGLQYIYMDA